MKKLLYLFYNLLFLSCESIYIKLTGSNSLNKSLIINEIILYNYGLKLDNKRIIINLYQSINDVGVFEQSCNDGNIDTKCSISGTPPMILIDTNGLYFDKIIIHSSDNSIYSTLIEVFPDSVLPAFWSYQIKDVHNVHIFDLGDVALKNFPMSIIDTFSYNGEPIALFHVKYLYPVVNQFIIVEGLISHSGQRKSGYYFQNPEIYKQFEPYMDKITYITVDEIPPRPDDYIDPTNTHSWMNNQSYDAFWRENYQRHIAQGYLSNLYQISSTTSNSSNPRVLVLVVDSDEIIDRNLLRTFRDISLYDTGTFHRKYRLGLHFFYYNFNWYSSSPWIMAYMADITTYLSYKDLLSARVLSSPPESTTTTTTTTDTDLNSNKPLPDSLLPNFGWHLSYFLSIDDIIRKIESITHREYDLLEYKSKEHIKECLRTGKDIYKRSDVTFQQLSLSESGSYLPEGWEEFQDEILRKQEIIR